MGNPAEQRGVEPFWSREEMEHLANEIQEKVSKVVKKGIWTIQKGKKFFVENITQELKDDSNRFQVRLSLIFDITLTSKNKLGLSDVYKGKIKLKTLISTESVAEKERLKNLTDIEVEDMVLQVVDKIIELET